MLLLLLLEEESFVRAVRVIPQPRHLGACAIGSVDKRDLGALRRREQRLHLGQLSCSVVGSDERCDLGAAGALLRRALLHRNASLAWQHGAARPSLTVEN